MSPINATRGSITTSRGTLYSVAAVTEPSAIPMGYGVDLRLRVQAGTVVLGGTSVTSSNGYRLVPTQPVSLNLDAGETLCAVRPSSGTTTVEILSSTRD